MLAASAYKAAFQYYGVDWMIMVLVLLGLFGIEEHRRNGFLLGGASAALNIVFSFQIHSIANLATAVTVLVLYIRGYLMFGKEKQAPQMAAKTA